MRYCIFDIETDGLYQDVTKIHCLSYSIYDDEGYRCEGTITEIGRIKDFILEQECLIGHNIIRYDIPVLEKLLDIKYEGKVIDTLAISWYLFPERHKHGLEGYGEEFNIPKPMIQDWRNLSIEEYKHRCETDVEINTTLWLAQKDYLEKIYDGDFSRIVGYLNFKFQCLLEQEITGITLDVRLCEEIKHNLEFIIEEKLNALSSTMPINLGKVLREKPKIMSKKDGTLSINGIKWFDLLNKYNLPEDTEIVYEEPNPGSQDQLKKWLFTLGWKPSTYKVNKNTGEKVPQISLPNGGGICHSVKELYIVEPNLKELEGLFIARHRLGLVKSFLENKDKDNKVYATAHGLTNTLRLAHSSPCVNLPSVFKPYGEQIRGVLTVPNNAYTMFGADLSQLEDSTKQHYIYFYDPEYVKQMRVPGFDAHIDIAILGGLLTQKEGDRFKELEKKESRTEDEEREYNRLKNTRGTAKNTNFAATYGAGAAKIAETAKISLSTGQKLFDTYWKRNWAVKETANSLKTKVVYGQKWLYNPISCFWYYLKSEKDKFSTLNQSSGVYIFDSWLRKVRQKLSPLGIKIVLQYHDEILGVCLKFQKEIVETLISEAIKETNEEVKLNVEIKNSIDWGQNYAKVH